MEFIVQGHSDRDIVPEWVADDIDNRHTGSGHWFAYQKGTIAVEWGESPRKFWRWTMPVKSSTMSEEV